MQDLNIADAGFSYIFKCIRYYYEGNIYFLLYILALAFLSMAGSRLIRLPSSGSRMEEGVGFDKRMREIFLPQFILMALTVYNPVFPVLLNSFFDVNKEYYRFLWMSPVIICIAAAGAVLCCDFAAGEKKSSVRMIVAAVFLICLLTAGGSYLYKDGYILSPDRYHMPTEIPEISEIIHKDADERAAVRALNAETDEGGEPGMTPSVVYPRVMFEYDYQMQIRQYDAGILLPCDREQYLRALAGEVTYDTAVEHGNYIDRLLAVTALGIKIPEHRFTSALKHTGTEYVVVTSANGMVSYLENAGLEVIGETANHTVLHYEPDEPEVFVLPDYSEVWRLTPQWYDFLL